MLIFIFFNMLVILGEMIINVKNFGLWLKQRCGIILFAEEEDEVLDEI